MENTHRRSLFVASCIALVVTAFSFAARADIVGALQVEFGFTEEQIGWINGPALWGFTLSMMFGGPFCDFLGMKKLIGLAFLGHLSGLVIAIFTGPISNATGVSPFATLYVGYLLLGIGCGLIEAACNPLVATIYDKDKTKMLNRFHVWFPGGMVIGGLTLYAMTKLAEGGLPWLNWQWKLGIMIVPTLIYGGMFFRHTLPVTERVASGISTSRMFTACLSPLFLVMLVAMLFTAATELGPNQWLPDILNFTTGAPGILVLVWISGLMALCRQFAGPVVHRLSPIGVLLTCAALSAIGLFLLSLSTSAAAAFGAASVFAIGVSYFWPTMLGFVSERLPQTGALGLSIFGGAGMLSASLILPFMGKVYQTKTAEVIPEPYKQAALADLPETAPDSDEARTEWELAQANPELYVRNALAAEAAASPDSEASSAWAKAKAEGGAATLGVVSVIPVGLLVIFGGVYLFDRRSRGGKGGRIEVDPEAVAAAEQAQPTPPPSPGTDPA